MVLGYLVPGVLAALLSAFVALVSGFGLLIAFGFYILVGSVTTLLLACIGLWRRLLLQPVCFATET